MAMTIGLCTLEFHLPGSTNLKQKRKFLNSLRNKLCAHYNVAFAEVDCQDLWQRSVVGVVSISNDRKVLDSTFQKVLRVAEGRTDAVLINFNMEFL
ncbi:MAG: DUF503 domain-containing protein [Myxococcales bacterium]|jgi:uncharacterized protein YlxP (DUF503 family)